MAWERVNGPLGSSRQDIQAANLICCIVNMFKDSKSSAFKLEDAMLFPSHLVGKSSRRSLQLTKPEDQLAYFMALAGLPPRDLSKLSEHSKPAGGA